MKRYNVYYDTYVMFYHEWTKAEDAARILAQRDRLAELLRESPYRKCDCEEGRDCGCNDYSNRRDAALAELDKEKQS